MSLALVLSLVAAGALSGAAVGKLAPSGKVALGLSLLPLPAAYLALPSC